MANKEVVTVLTVKTEQSQNTIKGLKAEIADLKKKLDTAVIGTDEFERASKELATAQANLKTVLADGKKTTDAVEGSYNHLVATMAELKKQWKATADEVKRNELGQQIDSINSKLKDMDASTGNFQRNVGDYANQFKEAFEEQQKSTQNVRLGLDGLQKTAAGLASGYAAVQGTLNLLNIESTEFEKAMIQVQSAMAIAQGIGGMKDLIEGGGTLITVFKGAVTGVKSFITSLNGIKAAIAATGIGVLVVLVGELYANWEKISKFFKDTWAIENTNDKINNLNRSVEENNDRLKTLTNEGLEDYLNKIRAAAGDVKKLKQAEDELEESQLRNNLAIAKDNEALAIKLQLMAGLAVAEKNSKKNLDELEKASDQVTDATNKRLEAEIALEKFLNNKNNSSGTTDTNTDITSAKDRANKQKEIEEEIRVSKLTEEEKLYDALEKKYEEYMKIFSNDKEKQLKIFDWYCDEYLKIVERELESEINAIEEANKKKKELEEADYSNRVALSEKRLDKKLDTIDRSAENATYINERKKPDGNGELDIIENELSKLETLKSITNETLNLKLEAIQIEQALFEETSARWIELEEQKKQIKEDTNRTLLELDEQYIEQSKAKNRALAGSITNTFTASLQAASSIMSALQEGLDTTTKEGFEKNKKVQIANAIIQTLVGVTTALSGAFTTKSGPWDIALAAIQASTIAATGAIQVANIRKQTFDGGSSATAAVNPSINLGETMPIQYTRELLTDSETTNLNKEQRVYVLESDITSTQENVKVKESNSSF